MRRGSSLQRTLGSVLERIGIDDVFRPRATRTALMNRQFHYAVLMDDVGRSDLKPGQRLLVCDAGGDYLFSMQRRPVAIREASVVVGEGVCLAQGVQALKIPGIHFGLSSTFLLAARHITHQSGFASKLSALSIASDQCLLLKELSQLAGGQAVDGLRMDSPLRRQVLAAGPLSAEEDLELTRRWRDWLESERKFEATRSVSDWRRHGFAVAQGDGDPYLYRSKGGLTFAVSTQDGSAQLPKYNYAGRLSVFVEQDNKYLGESRTYTGIEDLERQIRDWSRELKSQFLKGPSAR